MCGSLFEGSVRKFQNQPFRCEEPCFKLQFYQHVVRLGQITIHIIGKFLFQRFRRVGDFKIFRHEISGKIRSKFYLKTMIILGTPVLRSVQCLALVGFSDLEIFFFKPTWSLPTYLQFCLTIKFDQPICPFNFWSRSQSPI